MVRRNVVLIALVVPATAVSATLLSVIDRPSDAPSQSRIVAQPVVREAVAPATAIIAGHASSPRIEAVATITDSDPPAQNIDVVTPSPAARQAIASHSTRAGAVKKSAAAAITADRSSIKHAKSTVGRKASARPQPKAKPASGSSQPTAARVASPIRPAAPAVRIPQGGLAPMAGAEMSSADVWEPGIFEPPPITVVLGEALCGQPVSLALMVTNEDAQPEIFACHVAILAIGDDGESLGEIRPAANVTVAVDGDATTIQNLAPIQPDELQPWLSQTQFFNVVATGVGQVGGIELASDNYLYAPVPSIIVTLTPEVDVEAGDWVKVTIESDGPLGFAMTDVTLRLNGGVQLLQPGQTVFEDGTASDVVVSLGDLAAGSSFMQEIWFVAADPMWAWMDVQLEAQQILPQFNGAGLWDDGWWTDPDEGGDGGGSDAEPGDGGDGGDGSDGGDGGDDE